MKISLNNCDCIEFMQDMVNQGKKVDCILTKKESLFYGIE